MMHSIRRIRFGTAIQFFVAWMILRGVVNGQQTTGADLLLVDGKIECCDTSGRRVEAMAIRDGRIVALGSNNELMSLRRPDTQVLSLQGGFVTPGFADSHLHFLGLGESLQRVDLRTADSWESVVDMVAEQAAKTPEGEWVEGRGWHQSKWKTQPTLNVEGYPLHVQLSERVPNHPVVLIHASGHACIVNAKAMKLAGIDEQTSDPEGGELLRDAQGAPTGLLRENAQGLVRQAMLKNPKDRALENQAAEQAAILAGKECLKHGITSVHDAGVSFPIADAMGRLADEGKLLVRVYAMIREGSGELLRSMRSHRWLDRGSRLTIRSVKVSIDGALGPHGAWLLQPYEDLPTSVGLNTVSLDELDRIAKYCVQEDLQLCVHAIGDRANRETLNAFERALGNSARDHRWRVEHAQHIDPTDLPRFAKLRVIPVMQANHCTSDALYVFERLGQRRAAEGAYMWRALIDSGCIIPNGTDAPVELVDPRVSLYASVSRKLPDGESFFPQQCMSRQEALWSYTLWPAIASFQDKEIGSLELGKKADFVLWDTDLLHCPDTEILAAKVQRVWVDGKPVFELATTPSALKN